MVSKLKPPVPFVLQVVLGRTIEFHRPPDLSKLTGVVYKIRAARTPRLKFFTKIALSHSLPRPKPDGTLPPAALPFPQLTSTQSSAGSITCLWT